MRGYIQWKSKHIEPCTHYDLNSRRRGSTLEQRTSEGLLNPRHLRGLRYACSKSLEDVNAIICAPKNPGRIVRRQLAEGPGMSDLARSSSKNGQFPQEFADDCSNNYRWLLEQRDAINSHPVEVAGKKIRPMFS